MRISSLFQLLFDDANAYTWLLMLKSVAKEVCAVLKNGPKADKNC